LIEKRGVPAIRTQRNGGGVAVGARDEPGDWNSKCLARRKANPMRAVVRACNNECETETDDRGTENGGYPFHDESTEW
jgi:hypothetical protein